MSEVAQSSALRSTGIKSTSRGLIFLIAGVLTLWIPYASYLGYLLCLIGLALIYWAGQYFQSPHSTYARLAAWVALACTIAVFLIMVIFYAWIYNLVNPNPYPDNAVAREEMFNFSFLVYFYLTEFIGLLMIFSLTAGAWIIAGRQEKLLLSVGTLLFAATMLVIFLALSPSAVLPFNPPGPPGNYVLSILELPGTLGIYYAASLSIFAFSFIMIHRDLRSGKPLADPGE